ncbi:CGNR zinc finger domain-containing protein [Brevibacillus agri]|uniref:CGNR zinc finger domain-containing protein n=1 Tax=Brevibacillus agri TaxID=51101 RepID=UPI001EE5104E|nr:CGNR zinc finger domain-containing protein [Brevibacillus agri]MCG5253503.1 CGNR zinc finger domain-containing protein [Brevibacillus agri]MED1823295.1 CGNR zinc finger domain-containing protein [Brevibacillus agri]MED3501219.1 CGNR zinc finger domain-containing protein [Brevibacillus agri]
MNWLCIDFLNSDWRDWRGSGRRENRLAKQEWLEQLLREYALHAPLPIDEASAVALLRLREYMRSLLERVVRGEALRQEELEELNQALAKAPFHVRVISAGKESGYEQELVSASSGWELVMARIAASFATLLLPEHVQRIKICDNEDCRWVFYDESRNRVRRWCDDKMCGNLMKVRRFRERQKEKK